MSASGDFTPPESGGAAPPGPRDTGPRRHGVPVGAALGILAAVLVLGLVAVFAFGHARSSGTASFAMPGVTPSVGLPPGGPATAPAPDASGLASASAGASPASAETGTGTTAGAGYGGSESAGAGAGAGVTGGGGDPSPAFGPAFRVGECVDTSGSGSRFDVVEASCSDADYKIIYAFENESGNVDDDQPQCYTVNGSDDDFENGDSATGYTLYCMNSLIGDYSPRRAGVDNCLDSVGEYEVDCTSPRASWIVVGRLDGTTNTRGCSQFGSYDYSYFWSTPPPFVLCVDKYRR